MVRISFPSIMLNSRTSSSNLFASHKSDPLTAIASGPVIHPCARRAPNARAKEPVKALTSTAKAWPESLAIHRCDPLSMIDDARLVEHFSETRRKPQSFGTGRGECRTQARARHEFFQQIASDFALRPLSLSDCGSAILSNSSTPHSICPR